MKKYLKILAVLPLAAIVAGCGSKKETAPDDREEPLKTYTAAEVRQALMDIYDATGGSRWSEKEGWTGEGEISSWHGITCDASGNVTAIDLASNNLTGKLPDVFDRFPKLRTLDLSGNAIEGEIPQTLSKLREEGFEAFLSGNLFSATTFKVIDSKMDFVSEAMHVYPSDNPAFRLYVDSSRDGSGRIHDNGEVKVIHKAEDGNGFDIIFIGDGFDKDENTVGGTVDHWLDKAVENLFDVHPLKGLYDRCNIYFIYNHSSRRGISLGNNSITTYFTYQQRSLSNEKVQLSWAQCKTFIKNALGRAMKDNGVVVVIPNFTQNDIPGGYHAKQNSVQFALCPPRPSTFRETLIRQAGGFCMGVLGDETSGTAVLQEGKNPVSAVENADIESDPDAVKWSRFIADSRYSGEDLGVFEGCYGYDAGVYRPSQKSIMNSGELRNEYFNVPSRAAIYKNVMTVAFGATNYTFDYEDFVNWDLDHK